MKLGMLNPRLPIILPFKDVQVNFTLKHEILELFFRNIMLTTCNHNDINDAKVNWKLKRIEQTQSFSLFAMPSKQSKRQSGKGSMSCHILFDVAILTLLHVYLPEVKNSSLYSSWNYESNQTLHPFTFILGGTSMPEKAF